MKRILENLLLSARPKAFGVLCAVVGLLFSIFASALSLFFALNGIGTPLLQAFLSGAHFGLCCFWALVIIEVGKKNP